MFSENGLNRKRKKKAQNHGYLWITVLRIYNNFVYFESCLDRAYNYLIKLRYSIRIVLKNIIIHAH